MTTDEIKEYYANLLILQYRGKEKARATIKALVDPLIMDQIQLTVQDSYNLNTAVGIQLDVLGKYAGVSRNTRTLTAPVTLNDTDFRLMIKIKILSNSAGSSLSDIQDLIAAFFPGQLQVFDTQDMRLSYFFNSAGSSTLAEVLVRNGLLPKPMGVQLSSLIYLPSISNAFSFSTYDQINTTGSGFNDSSNYHTDRPWLTYANSISF